MSVPYQVKRKCCATCRYWDGDRKLEFRANKLFQVQVTGLGAPCMAKPNSAKQTPVNYCSMWRISPQLEP